MIENHPFTIESLRQSYKSGTTPADIVEEVYRRIEAVDDPGIFILLFDKNEVLETAEAREIAESW